MQRILRQLEWAGRGTAGQRAIEAIRTGWTEGMAAGLEREAAAVREAVVDPEGGKTGIRQFMDKKSPPLPVRRNGVFIDSEHDAKAKRLEAAGDLLPVGAPFFPGITADSGASICLRHRAHADTGAPRFGQPATHERELDRAGAQSGAERGAGLLLTSEVNFNDIWALTGIPVSPFDGHEEDFQTTGSGGSR
jgi:acrylyl-CoA reductase (NADPH) / 3-hydroxypropionyl-CoA dehydratase / 3-hydroxypropionyl-CoA synthetase